MTRLNLEKNGVEIIKINKNIRSLIVKDIKKNISKKLKLDKNTNFNKISKYLKDIDDLTFNRLFGKVTARYLSPIVTTKINSYINKFKLNRKFKKVFLHQMTPSDLKENKELKKNYYCVFYRVVRKNKKDTSFVHRDCDFWKLHSKNKSLAPTIPGRYTKRIKLWFPIYGCVPQNSLNFFNYSHVHKIKWKYKSIKGFYKPEIDKSYAKKNKKNVIMPFKNFRSDVALFDDACVHFAPQNISTDLRVSCELTAMVLE